MLNDPNMGELEGIVDEAEDQLTDIILIADRSGSMYAIKEDAIGGLNSFIESQKDEIGHARLTTILFNNECEVIHDRVDIGEVEPFTSTTYVTQGTTALLDAIGKAIVGEEAKLATLSSDIHPDNIIFAILTDGEENASHEYTHEQIMGMINDHKDTGWAFLFLAANQDAIQSGAALGIDAGATLNFAATSEGVHAGYGALSHSVSSYRRSGGTDVSF